MSRERSHPAAFARRVAAGVALLGILALALAIRLEGLADQPVSLDAFSSVIHLDPPAGYRASPFYEKWRLTVEHEDVSGLLDYLARNRTLDPAAMPLYYGLEYLWHTYLWRDLYGVRVLSLLMGMALCAVLFLLGRELFGTGAGLMAALCVALSPVHRFYAQEIRMYVLLALLAAVSAYTFIKLVRGNEKRWWIAHAAANLLLTWTHPFAALLLAAEGLYWWGARPREVRRWLAWGMLQTLVALPAVAYVASIQFWPATNADFMTLPSLRWFLGDLLADDAVGFTTQFRPLPGFAERILPSAFSGTLMALYVPLGILLVALYLYLVLNGVSKNTPGKAGETPALHEGRFLLLWWLLPPLALYIISALWRPCIHPRYTLHCSLALYLLAGGGIAALPHRAARWGASAALTALMACQCVYAMGGIQGADWRGAAEWLRREAAPTEAIVHHDGYYGRAFAYNLGPVANPVTAAQELDSMAELAAFVLHDASAKTSAWALTRGYGYRSAPPGEFERCLAARGLDYTVTGMHDADGLALYRIQRIANAGAAPELRDPNDFHRVLAAYAIQCYLAGNVPEAGHALDTLTALSPVYATAYGYDYLRNAVRQGVQADDAVQATLALQRAYGYRANGQNEFALAEFEKALALAPDHPAVLSDLGLARAREGRYEDAAALLARLAAQYPVYRMVFAPFLDAVATGDSGQIRRDSELLTKLTQGYSASLSGDFAAAATLFTEIAAAQPQWAVPYLCRSIAEYRAGDVAGATIDLDAAIARAPEIARYYGAPLDALIRENNPLKAAAALQECLAHPSLMVPPDMVLAVEAANKRK